MTTLSDVANTARWFQPGEVLSVAGRTIRTGFVYGGWKTSSSDEPSLIDPRIPVTEPGQKPVERFSSGTSYSEFSPSYRGAYLDWLARGRTGEVFPAALYLFLMGIERRWAEEGVCSLEELAGLADECRRIADVYVGVEAATTWAADLSDAIRLWMDGTAPSDLPVDFNRGSGVRTWTGLRLFSGLRLPLPADLALLLAYQHPHGACLRDFLRHDEFRALFAIRYRVTHGEGITLPLGYPAPHQMSLRNPTLPQAVRFLALPFEPQAHVEFAGPDAAALLDLAVKIKSEVQPYLRHKRASAPTNVGLLPEVLVEQFGKRETEELVEIVEAALRERRYAHVTWADILSKWRAPDFQFGLPHRLTNVLTRYGLGFEPHPEYSTRTWLSPDLGVVFFRAHDAPTPRVSAVAGVLDLIIPALKEAGLPAQRAAESLFESAEVSDAEVHRLDARVVWHGRYNARPSFDRSIAGDDYPTRRWLYELWSKPIYDARPLSEIVPERTYQTHRAGALTVDVDLPPRTFRQAERRERIPESVITKTPVSTNPEPEFIIDEVAAEVSLQESDRATAYVEGLRRRRDPSLSRQLTEPRLSTRELAVLSNIISSQPTTRPALDSLCRAENIYMLALIESVNQIAFGLTGEPAIEVASDVHLEIDVLKTIHEREHTPDDTDCNSHGTHSTANAG
ncbi:MAG TPA: TerB N-terminal domain-containing protein [Thermoanaerobaculia bacterium]